jgi:Mg-chelatase subunit ChlD
MCRKKYRMTILIFTVLICCLCTTGHEGWSKEYSPNVHWVFCIDTSGSMKTKGHMDLLKAITERIDNEFMSSKKKIIRFGDRITIFSFDENVRLEATSVYQTENDLSTIRDKLVEMNKRSGSLTFISEAIVRSMDFTDKYKEFFDTSALYVFTDGKSEPYSPKWTEEKIALAKKKDQENFNKISLAGTDHGLNIWLGVLKWEAFNDANALVKRMGSGGHLVDLTDFNRLSLEKALNDFAEMVRYSVRIPDVKHLDFGTISYSSDAPYKRNITVGLQADKVDGVHPISGQIRLDPDNPSGLEQELPLEIKTTEDKMVLNLKIPESDALQPGQYKGRLELFPSELEFGAVVIEPSEFEVTFAKSGFLGFYLWRFMAVGILGLMFLLYATNKIRRKIPIRI